MLNSGHKPSYMFITHDFKLYQPLGVYLNLPLIVYRLTSGPNMRAIDQLSKVLQSVLESRPMLFGIAISSLYEYIDPLQAKSVQKWT